MALGKSILVKPSQEEKHPAPNDIAEGKLMAANFKQSKNKIHPMTLR